MAPEHDRGARQLGEFIRMQRQMADLSLRGMAELTKVSNAYLSQVERGLHSPSVRVLRAIAEALNIPAATLLAQLGEDPEASKGPGTGPSLVEEAIRVDPGLGPEERDVLIRVYRSLVNSRQSSA